MILKNRNFLNSFAALGLLITSVCNAGSLLKLDLGSQEVLINALEATRTAYAKAYADQPEVTFKPSTFTPHTTLLFLSALDNDSDLINVSDDTTVKSAQLVLSAAQTVANRMGVIEIESGMKITHQPGSPRGVPTSGISAGTPYHSVVIELPAATEALTPLMNSLKDEISAVVTRKSASDYAPRIHLTVGYVIGVEATEPVAVDGLKNTAQFKVESFILDFPKLAEFKNVVISPIALK